MNDDSEIEYSPLCQSLERDGRSVEIHIYRCIEPKWTLEVVDEYGTSTVWDDLFETDAQALFECLSDVQKDGIASVCGPVRKAGF